MRHSQQATVISCLIVLSLFLFIGTPAVSADIASIPLKALGPGIKGGTPAPDFSFQDQDGKTISLSDFRGKKVLLFSWSSWCRCKYQLPELEKFYRKHKSDRFEIITVASDAQGFKWARQYLDLADASFIALVDPNMELPQKYNTIATENAWLIDEAGIIRMNSVPFYIHDPEHKKRLVELIDTDFKSEADKSDGTPLAERISQLESGLASKPGDFAKRLELAELYRQQGDLEKAESILREALKKRRTSADARLRLGVVLYQQGRVQEAVAEWEKAYRYEPSYIHFRNVQSYNDPDKFYSELTREPAPKK